MDDNQCNVHVECRCLKNFVTMDLVAEWLPAYLPYLHHLYMGFLAFMSQEGRGCYECMLVVGFPSLYSSAALSTSAF